MNDEGVKQICGHCIQNYGSCEFVSIF